MKKIFITIFLIICAYQLFGQVNVIAPELDAGSIVTTIDVPITVDDLTGLGVTAYEFVITFDKDVVNATGVSIVGTITPAGTFAFGNPDNTNGKITVAAASTLPIVGEGILIYLQFNVIQHTQSPLIWESFTFNTGTPVAILTDGNIILPVELTSFKATLLNNGVNLQWETGTEVNNYGFEIERKNKYSHSTWKDIAFINGAGNSNSPKLYSFIDKNLIGGTHFIYRLKQIDNDGSFKYSDEIEIEIVTNNHKLYQNYPNPFNPSTKIRFSLSESQKVQLKIYDAVGNEVKDLFDGNLEAGFHEVTIKAEDLASGIYYYRIKAGNFVDTKKLILLK